MGRVYWRRTQIRAVGTTRITPPLPLNENPASCWVFLFAPFTHSMSAIRSKADIGLNLARKAATDPKRTSQEAAPRDTNPLHPPLFCHPVTDSGVLSLLEKDGFR